MPFSTDLALDPEKVCQLGRAVLTNEAQAITSLLPRINENFVRACHYLLACKGRIVVIGMGKSGHIAKKIAATLASTGNPAFFIHPAEASHGDLGMITSQDVVLALSNSGETHEIIALLPILKMLNLPLITLTGNPNSLLALTATVNIDVSVAAEACPLGLAPTSSTTAALAMGDALAVALLEAKGFTINDYARSHPGGQLGRRLLLRSKDIMHTGTQMPKVSENTPLQEALFEMTSKGMGLTTVVKADGRLAGIFTDGDLRRAFNLNIDLRSTPIHTIMTKDCKVIEPDLLAAEALQIMEENKITALIIVDSGHKPLGVLHMHDVMQTGLGQGK